MELVPISEIKSVWDPNSRSMLVNEKTITEDGGPSNQFNSDIQTFEPDTAIMVTGVILSAYNDPDGNTVLETNEGRTVLPKGTSYAISDDAGNGYLVDKEGNIKKTTTADALAAGAKANREYSTDPNLKVIFSRAEDTKYGFDEPQTVLPQNYQQTEAGDKVAWNALATGLPDNVVAASQGTGGIANATFKLGQNPQVPSPNTLADGQVQLTLIGKADGTIEEQLAYYPNPDTSKTDLVAGKLNVVSYDLVNKNLVLITVNATTTTLAPNSLQTELNNIYSQGVVQWTVNSTQSINVNGIDENALDDGGSGLLSNYTEDMKKILRAYTADHAMVSDTYYLFLVKNATSQSKLGYMPRKKQAGFIFVDAHNNSDIVKSIAHELGHGAFHLKHTFSEYPSLSQGVTENLMDYPAKTRLDKWQWDHIHNPEAVLGLFEGDDEGALKYDCPKWFLTSKECESVGRVLDYIKLAVEKGATLTIKWNEGKSEYVAENIELDGIKYDKIKIINSIQKSSEVTFDPRRYENLPQDITMLDGKTGQQGGFVFKTETVGLLPLSYFEVITVLLYQKDNFETKIESLKNYLFGEIVKEIVVHYKRKGRNDYRTWGQFSILGTNYTGYVLERPKGNNSPEFEDYKRIPAGTYNLVYSSSSNGLTSKFWGVTMCIEEHPGYKLHGGNRADQSDGCLLINEISPQVDKYPDAFQYKLEDIYLDPDLRRQNTDRIKVANEYYGHSNESNPALKLRRFIEALEEKIKKEFKLEQVVRKIIIDESEEVIEP